MKKLLKQYGFNCDMQYYEMIIESVVNGQKDQAKNQYSALPKKERKIFVAALIRGYWNHPLENDDIVFFVNI